MIKKVKYKDRKILYKLARKIWYDGLIDKP